MSTAEGTRINNLMETIDKVVSSVTPSEMMQHIIAWMTEQGREEPNGYDLLFYLFLAANAIEDLFREMRLTADEGGVLALSLLDAFEILDLSVFPFLRELRTFDISDIRELRTFDISDIDCGLREIAAWGICVYGDADDAYPVYQKLTELGYQFKYKESYLNLAEICAYWDHTQEAKQWYRTATTENRDPRFGMALLKRTGIYGIWVEPRWPFAFPYWDDEPLPGVIGEIPRWAEECFVARLGDNPVEFLNRKADELRASPGDDDLADEFFDLFLSFYGLVLVGVAKENWTAVGNLAQDAESMRTNPSFRAATERVLDFDDKRIYEDIFISIAEYGERARNLPTQGQIENSEGIIRARLGTCASELLAPELKRLAEAVFFYERYKQLPTHFLPNSVAMECCKVMESVLKRTIVKEINGRFTDRDKGDTVFAYLRKRFSTVNLNRTLDVFRRSYPRHLDYFRNRFPTTLERLTGIRNRAAHASGEIISSADMESLRKLIFGDDNSKGMLSWILELKIR